MTSRETYAKITLATIYDFNVSSKVSNVNMDDTLEKFLYELEKSLKDFAPSQRAKIISKTSVEIHNEKNKFPEKSTKELLRDLGDPSQLANHYRLESGMKTFRPKKYSFLKFLLVFCFSMIFLFTTSIGLLVWKFTPLVKIDEENQRFTLLGGLIDINEKNGRIKVFDQYKFTKNNYSNIFDGKYNLDKNQDEVLVKFNTGILEIKTSDSSEISWSCKLESPPTKDIIEFKQDIVRLRLDEYGGGSCEVHIPRDTKVTIEGLEGEVTLLRPEFDAFIDLTNGNIRFIPMPEVEYNYTLRVPSDMTSNFPIGSNSTEAYEIQIELEAGSITYEQ